MVVVVVMGVSGSGKTAVGESLAEKIGCVFADADNWHSQENVDKMSSGIPLTDQDRLPWLEALHGLLRSWENEPSSADRRNAGDVALTIADDRKCTQQRFPMVDSTCASVAMRKKEDTERREGTRKIQEILGVLACSALRRTYRQVLAGTGDAGVESVGVNCLFVVLNGKEELLWQRLQSRQKHYMPPSLLRSQLETLELPQQEEARSYVVVEDLTVSLETLVDNILQQLLQIL